MKALIWTLLDIQLIDHLKKSQYLSPSDVQAQILLSLNKHINNLIIAPTGTGKSVCLVLYLLNLASAQPAIKILFVVPTRELASQVIKTFNEFNCFANVKTQLIKKSVAMATLNCANIFVFTPDQLSNLRSWRQNLRHKQNLIVVLDEVDALIRMNFLATLKAFCLQSNFFVKQKIAASATLKKGIKPPLKHWLQNYNSLIIDRNLNLANHYYLTIRAETKLAALLVILKSNKASRGTIIFANSKKAITTLHTTLQAYNFKLFLVHGDLSFQERKQVSTYMQNVQQEIILSTDLLSRGISLKQIQTVINWEFPSDLTNYLHRSGRTGRINQPGDVFSLVLEEQIPILDQLGKQNVKIAKARIHNEKLILEAFKSKRLKPINQVVANQIKQVYAQAADLQVKPNYKKKLKQAVQKIKQRARHEQIELQVKQQLLKKWKKSIRKTKANY